MPGEKLRRHGDVRLAGRRAGHRRRSARSVQTTEPAYCAGVARLSQVELARHNGTVTAASISQFENGHARPAAATLDALASTLRVPVTFFIAGLAPDDESQFSGFFRSLRSTTPRERRRALALVGVARALVAELEGVTALPKLVLPRHPVDPQTEGDVIELIA